MNRVMGKNIYCHLDTSKGLSKYTKLSFNKKYEVVGYGYNLVIFNKKEEVK